ncbi:hypothetical protein CY34DRAFT_15387 [Suillus luteus UH-Slu-Lm8-n1]|uniref:DUF6533 domain-containing protein n=1 Tax=Suillus luteus UH-Slu-Lm8-n1 TaxID=930992 RepID=A0A0D0A8E2_9AGAM|nr:hypothetical protein CY34DRAFT_15387 [Suillus luteus UH-Slu-Lm8-n1]
MQILAIQALSIGISSTNTIVLHPQHPPPAHTHPSNMTFVSNDPSLRPYINWNIVLSYWIVVGGVVVVYDWALTLGQEIELIWIRYIGMPYSVLSVLGNITYYTLNGANMATTALLGVIMIARLHAMYQRSRIMLIFLVIIFLAVNIACKVLAAIVLVAIGLKHAVAEEMILSGMYTCIYEIEWDVQLLFSTTWTLSTGWEVLTLCLSVWIAVKRFRDLRHLGPSTGSIIGDCYRVLIKSHVLYFASFAAVL